MTPKWFLLIPVFLLAWPLRAQQTKGVTITGVVHTADGKPMEFVNVFLLKAADSSLVKGAVTDQLGRYEFASVGVGTYRVSANGLGFQRVYSESFELNAGQQTYQVPLFALQELAQQLAHVTIKAQKPFIEQQIDKTILNVENSLVASGGTVLEILEKAPGVVVDLQAERISLKGRENVLVMIDGKPSYLSVGQVMELLRNTPSNTVETIELISNPSSRYDAAGTAGIINIRLKRNRSDQALSGNVTLGGGQGRFPKYNASALLNARRGKWTLFGNYAFDKRDYWSVANIDRRLSPNGLPTLIRQTSYRPIQNTGHTYRLGADFAPDKRNMFSVLVNGMSMGQKSQGGTESDTYQSDVLTLSERTQNANRRTVSRLAVNGNYRHVFDSTRRGGKEHELLVDIDYSNASFRPSEQFVTQYLNARQEEIGPRTYQRLNTTSNALIQAAKLDYSYPFDKRTMLEMGLKGSYVTLGNDLLVETQSAEAGQTTPWLVDTSRSNQFTYRERIIAGYFTARRTWGDWTLQVGLRTEQTQNEAESVTANSVVERSYINLFPSVTLTRNLGENHQFQYSFGRRIDRPDYQYLNPFIRIFSPYAYQQGNPYLKPQYTDAFQVSYSYKQETTISAGFNRITDVIVDVNEQNDLTGATRITFANLAEQMSINVTGSIPYRFASWWSSRNTGSILYNAYQAELAGSPLNYTWFTTNLSTTHSFLLGRGLTGELVATYNSPYVYSQNMMQAFGQVSIGLQQTLWQKKAVLRFNWSDLLQTQRFRGAVDFQQMNFRFATYSETRIARLTFTYNLGNKNVKGATNRKTVSEEEQRRMN